MKYYSTMFNRLYDTVEELEQDETAYKLKERIAAEKAEKEKAEKEAKEKEKKEDVKKLEAMIKDTTKAINEYVKKYGKVEFKASKDDLPLFPFSPGLFDFLTEIFT